MKLVLVLMLCAIAAAAPKLDAEEQFSLEELNTAAAAQKEIPQTRNFVVNALVRQLIAYLRRVINNGSSFLGIRPLDPLQIESYNLRVPAGLFYLDLNLENVFATGIGGFVVHTSNLNLRTMTFDLDISVPSIEARAGTYKLNGHLFSAIPLFGDGDAVFKLENFRFQAKLFLKQSDDGKSILIDRIESPAFQVPSFKVSLTGVIGGGDIDGIANAIIEEVFLGYVLRFHNLVAAGAAQAIMVLGNPILDKLDTWRFIAPFV